MIAQMSGESLLFDGAIIVGTDLIDLLFSGRSVPIFGENTEVGRAYRNKGHLVHLDVFGNHYTMVRKCLLDLVKGNPGDSIEVRHLGDAS